MNNNNETTAVKGGKMVPSWVLEGTKLTAVAVTTLGIGYARFVVAETKLSDSVAAQVKLENRFDARGEVIDALKVRVTTLEVNQAKDSQQTAASLARIETTLHEVQADVKALQTHKTP